MASKSSALATVDALLSQLESELGQTLVLNNESAQGKAVPAAGPISPPSSYDNKRRSLLSRGNVRLERQPSNHSSVVSFQSSASADTRSQSTQQTMAHTVAGDEDGYDEEEDLQEPEDVINPGTQIIHSGSLRKSTPSNNPMAGRQWRPRFFVLSDTFIYLFRSSASTEVAMSALPITPATTAFVSAEGMWVLEVHSPCMNDNEVVTRQWRLQCAHRDEMVEWLAVLRSAVDRAKLRSVSSGSKTHMRYPPSNSGKGQSLEALMDGSAFKLSRSDSGKGLPPSVSSPPASTHLSPLSYKPTDLMSSIALLEDLERSHSTASSAAQVPSLPSPSPTLSAQFQRHYPIAPVRHSADAVHSPSPYSVSEHYQRAYRSEDYSLQTNQAQQQQYQLQHQQELLAKQAAWELQRQQHEQQYQQQQGFASALEAPVSFLAPPQVRAESRAPSPFHSSGETDLSKGLSKADAKAAKKAAKEAAAQAEKERKALEKKAADEKKAAEKEAAQKRRAADQKMYTSLAGVPGSSWGIAMY
ncbi:uncharacterized protein EV422DRAFT_502837 [Fimicolochytrium jonesii]|uniref:uncharacterized protein n=1 Tax=Fimicolochytrium jonesii TaxID=1396493 RepID=UPI0022FF3F80|nr:uncharacterized protein EV422DRAFT_502837 [Fimicolochytrium jonesii]KAI8827135.1 hypothetical protein EV422DRAFT_502837 [Fimicolochytrium jonesii]